MAASRKYAGNTRGRPFEPGNPGRPKGARHKVTRAVEALLDGEAEALTRAAVELALNGNVIALRLCLDRIATSHKECPITFDLPALADDEGGSQAIAAVLSLVSAGELTPGEGQALVAMLDARRRAIETEDLAHRIVILEEKAGLS